MASRGEPGSTESLREFLKDPFFRAFAATLVEDLPLLTDEVVRLVLAEDLFYGELGEPPVARLRDDVDDNLGHIVRAFAGEEPLDFDRARAVAERAAAGGVPLAAVLHVYRLGAQVIWDHVVHHGSWREQQPDLDTVLQGGSVVWKLTDAFSKVISEVYDDTAAERFRRSERERTLLLDALLEGRAQDLPRLADVARILDLPEQGELVVVVAENPSTGAEGLPDVESVLRAERVPCAWRLRSQRHIGVVAIGTRPHGVGLQGVCELLAKRAVARVGVSPVYGELGDTARHVALADLALGCLPAGERGVAQFDDHPLDALVARSPELSERVVRLILDPVLQHDEGDVLLETLEAWMASGGSTSRAASRMFCHRNTVRNRLQRIESLTGRTLSEPEALSELCLAVKALALAPQLRDRPRSPR